MLKRDFFKGKRVTVFGVGLNGGALGAIEFLEACGVKEVIATDIRSREELAPTLKKLAVYKNITYVLGQHRPEDFVRTDLVIKSPGIPWTNEYVRLALEKNIPVETDASLFFQLTSQRTVAVTGTRGKSTTASMIQHILHTAGLAVVPVGINQIGFLSEVNKLTQRSIVVAELSSWRLSSLRRMRWSPSVAVITNFYPDHQNYYKSMEAYAQDKQTVLAFQQPQDIAVLNADEAPMVGWAKEAPGTVVWYSSVGEAMVGMMLREGTVWQRTADGEKSLGVLKLPWLLGEHNLSNALAAITAAVFGFGVAGDKALAALESFRGLPHRLEFVAERAGIQYVNDTAATSPEALEAALGALHRPTILIMGGADKQFDFAALAQTVLQHAKAVILLPGSGTEKFLPLFERAARSAGDERIFPVVGSMRDALLVAEENAASGDTILLSPGMASFGLFKNEFDRGEQFRQLVLTEKQK